MSEKQGKRMFWGYIIVAAGFFAGIFLVGQSVVLGIFFKSISEELGWLRASMSVAMSINSVVAGVSAVFAGKLTDKYGPRVVLIGGAISLALAYVLLSRLESLWQLYLAYGLFVGIAMGCPDVPIVTTVSRWFARRRGIMVGITKVGAGLGMMIFPIFANRLMFNFGWSKAYLYIGIIVFAGLLLAALFFRRDPAQMNQFPDGDTAPLAIEQAHQDRHYSIKEAATSRQFWLFAAVWAIFNTCVQAVLLHTANHVTDVGLSTAIAASVISAIGGFSIVGRFALASLSDRIGSRLTYLIALSLLTLAMFWIQFAQTGWAFYVFAALYGLAHGGCFALLAPMLSNLFGLGSLGSIMGVIVLCGALGGFIGPVAAGSIFDATGSYNTAFLIMSILCLIGVLLIFLLKPMKAGEKVIKQEK